MEHPIMSIYSFSSVFFNSLKGSNDTVLFFIYKSETETKDRISRILRTLKDLLSAFSSYIKQ